LDQEVRERVQAWRASKLEREQRARDKRKALLLLAVVPAFVVVTLAQGELTVLKAVGLRIVQGVVLLAAAWASWAVVNVASEEPRAAKERGER
jgi:hypothetical protein